MQKITPFLWFAGQAEEAVAFYTSIFKHSRVTTVLRYSEEAAKVAGVPEGTVMTVAFQLNGQDFTALNGGPQFKFTEAISFIVNCETQEEIDYYWEKLSAGGDEKAQMCGWLKDKFGLSWQIVPTILPQLLSNSEPDKAGRVMSALLQMKKLDVEILKQA